MQRLLLASPADEVSEVVVYGDEVFHDPRHGFNVLPVAVRFPVHVMELSHDLVNELEVLIRDRF